jgi:hypothetical protein
MIAEAIEGAIEASVIANAEKRGLVRVNIQKKSALIV